MVFGLSAIVLSAIRGKKLDEEGETLIVGFDRAACRAQKR
jgi:hypothetical protein